MSIPNDILVNTDKNVIQQLSTENFYDDLCPIDSDFYQKLKDDDRIIAYQIARKRLRKLRESDYDVKDVSRLTDEELVLSNLIKKEVENYLHIIENLKPVQETPLEIKFKELYPNERVGPFCIFTSWNCRNCDNENHQLCTSAVLVKALTNFTGEACCSCYRLYKPKHKQVKEFIPKGLFKKSNYDDSSSLNPIITESTKVYDD